VRVYLLSIFLALASFADAVAAISSADASLGRSYALTVQPFVQTYCIPCHSGDKPKGDFNLNDYSTIGAVARDPEEWQLVLEKLDAEEMPPAKAKKHPSTPLRQAVIEWVHAMRESEAKKHAGDPGPVLARRLSNSEYDYTVRDLTGVDIQPAREFPIDPSNTAGFDNSGESLVMSPALLDKYLKAAREVADHLYLKPSGFAFAPYPMLVETDRDKFCVQQIIDLYHRQDTDYAHYFEAAWHYKHRATLGQPQAKLADFTAGTQLSAKYLTTIWTLLEGPAEEVGPTARLQRLWQQLPAPSADQGQLPRLACEQMRDYVVQARRKVEMRFLNITAGKIGAARQPFLIWKNVQYATHRREFDPAQLQVAGEPPPAISPAPEPETSNPFGPGRTRLVKNIPGDPDLTVPAGERARYEAAFGRFCRVFPDLFYKEERGRNYFDTSKDRGRYLSAGFHNVMGYFRDDQALYELILDDQGQKELDERWEEMDFVASTTRRMYVQFGSNREALGTVTNEEAPEGTQPEDNEATSVTRIRQLEAAYLEQANNGPGVAIEAIKDYFNWINATLRREEQARLDAEPSHLQAVLQFAAVAYRRPLSQAEKDDLLAYYQSMRTHDGLDHESAIRELIVSVLMAPDTCYHVDLAPAGPGIRALTDYELASRLSYFLWSSLPDDELLAHAARGDLHTPLVLVAQAQRMLQDPRIRDLAVEFGGNWLDFRRFEGITTVDRDRFASFNDDLREAMFEEPVRFLLDVFQHNRSVLDCLYARDTFVNLVLAKHYGIALSGRAPTDWVRVEDATPYGRGGLLPMAVFLTKNAPGLRTSPVKRGNWVVKNVLGERIPPPPPAVPELPRDEAKLDLPLRDMLARHRADPNCAACHARFDALGLVFEGYGPTGERREKDLGGRPIDAHATFPGGGEGNGLPGLQEYIRAHRQNDFVNNLCTKLLVFALGRSPIPSDDALVQLMRERLVADGYHFDSLIQSIVTSPQFLNKRGRNDLAQN
jgi:mono/diheme cytochrome c family protein